MYGTNLEEQMLSVRRLGIRDDSRNEPRLIKVELNHERTSQKIIRAAPKLASASDEEIKRIKVFQDRNKEDRENRRKLVAEMKQKNEDLQAQNIADYKWIIRGENVVKIKVNPQQYRPNQRNF